MDIGGQPLCPFQQHPLNLNRFLAKAIGNPTWHKLGGEAEEMKAQIEAKPKGFWSGCNVDFRRFNDAMMYIIYTHKL